MQDDIRSIANNLPNIMQLLLKILIFPFLFPFHLLVVGDILKKANLDRLLVINGGYPAGEICLAATISWGKINREYKAWHNFHNLSTPIEGSKFSFIRVYHNFIDKLVGKYAEGFVSVSKACLLSIQNRNALINKKFAFIYNGLSIEKEKNIQSIRNQFGLKREAKILLMLAVYESRKGHDFIFRVMENIVEENKQIYLLAFGDGTKEEFETINDIRKKSTAAG